MAASGDDGVGDCKVVIDKALANSVRFDAGALRLR
jgi:hypothetical protein